MKIKCYLESFLMELVQMYYLPRHHHIYVVFIPVILFGEFGLQSYLSSKVPQVFLIWMVSVLPYHYICMANWINIQSLPIFCLSCRSVSTDYLKWIYIALHHRQIGLSPLVIFSNFEAISLTNNDYFLNTCVNPCSVNCLTRRLCFPFLVN